ncbi:hypothetical protein ACTWJ8_31630 [Streptomyces sp. SDT5-1]|uniref:hypothetical protein n=1 Tax=Streptomyces sp. SDT5-1 TaxID=3406418 RepID=UPI003FD43440
MRPYHLIPVIPALALLLMPFLPFVNTNGLWFGLPRMMTWGIVWCLACCPALLITERLMHRDEEQRDTTDHEEVGA